MSQDYDIDELFHLLPDVELLLSLAKGYVLDGVAVASVRPKYSAVDSCNPMGLVHALLILVVQW